MRLKDHIEMSNEKLQEEYYKLKNLKIVKKKCGPCLKNVIFKLNSVKMEMNKRGILINGGL